MKRGVESIVGAYLAILVVIGLITGFHTWIDNSMKNMNSQLNNSIERLHYIIYPPVLSLKYLNETRLKLVIYPYTPIYIDEILVNDIKGELIYSVKIEKDIIQPYGVELPLNKTSLIKLVIVLKKWFSLLLYT